MSTNNVYTLTYRWSLVNLRAVTNLYYFPTSFMPLMTQNYEIVTDELLT